MKATWLLAIVLAGETTGTRSAEDDLALVKKAVAARPAAPATTPMVVAQEGAGQKGDPQEREATRPARKGKEPQWLRLRVAERGGKKVSVNLPLALVRAIGEDWPIELHCNRPWKERTRLRLGDVLRALDSGQDLVQVDEEDATVRVWVE